ncbi:MAG TPA: hypothetical protein DCE80_17110 [Ignavibacteriales bacterium]|nr:hypothetical protein [Ignavibacteriales bacterium]
MIIFFLFLFFQAIISYAQTQSFNPTVVARPYAFDKTIPLRNMNLSIPPDAAMVREDKVIPNKDGIRKLVESKKAPVEFGSDNVVQDFAGTNLITSTPILNFDGVDNRNGVLPPDTQGDVGPNHYVQMVNLSFQIWDKNGSVLLGPANNSVLWNGFGDPWDGRNDGDPIVLYDELADRWLFSQFALPNYPNGPFYILIAITETGDPTGSWYRYGYSFNDMPDYPKFAVWPDGYYMTINQFASGGLTWAGAGIVVFERDLMLAGNPNASMIFWDFSSSDDPWSFLPSDFDGPPPPPGTPNYLAYFNDNSWGYTSDHLRILECNVNWANPSSSTITGPTILNTSPFKSSFTGSITNSRNNIPQPGTTRRLDALSSRLLFRLQYRNFGTYQTMVANHTVNVASSGNLAGVRWYELRNTGSGWSIFQQGTYAPDTHNRWIGSIAMDGFGNIALGYSVSSSTVYPSIRYTGRMRDDPLGQMTITEQTIIGGTGSQTHSSSRWGDYSMMSVDPIDDATFWYTNEYIQTTGSAPWRTRIGSFTFGLDLDLKVFLQGPYSGSGEMTTQLNSSNYLPNEQPYDSSPWNHNGVEKVTDNFFTTNQDIVDWVLVELRTGTAPSSTIARRAALLNKFGKVVGLDGARPLRFGLPPGNYYVVIRHRNHLDVMSAIPVTMPGAQTK